LKLYLERRLLFTSVVLEYQGQSITLNRVLVDTGSAATIFQTELLASIGLVYAPDDEVHEVFGVGGSELVFQKRLGKIVCSDLSMTDFAVEVGWLDYGIELDGILGLNFLLATRAILDLSSVEPSK
jgi:Aspartyl protease